MACNTASAKALRSIQQNDLPEIDPNRRVLGVIHPTVELLGKVSKNGMIGVLGTPGTIDSESYSMEIDKLYPDFDTVGQACPMWVPLVENMEYDSPGADYFVQKYINELMEQNEDIDTIILGCTHYPLLIDKINKYVPEGVNVISQGPIGADSLADYLTRHTEMDSECSKGGSVRYLTTENPLKFEKQASIFLGDKVKAHQIELEY